MKTQHTPGPFYPVLTEGEFAEYQRLRVALPDLIAAAVGAIAALSQPALFQSDAEAAKSFLRAALAKAGAI